MSHVLAISGMHISYVVIGIQFVLNKFINNQKLKNYILILILAFFAIITGASSSCVRACIMSAMLFISQNFYRKNNFYITILFTFMVLLFMNPYNIFSVGMWLSFGGTLGIVLFQKFFKRFLECKFKIKSKFFISFLDIILVSISAQVLILPIMIYCFNSVSLTFFISNLLIYFLVGPILALGYISLIIGMLILPVGNFIAIFENFLIFLIFKIAEICSKIPFSKILVVTPNFWMLILYYVVISAMVYFFHIKKFKFLRFILGKGTTSFVKKYYIKIVSSLLILILTINIIKIVPKSLKIHFVDVGQGDCTVLQTSGGKNIIIDGGNNQKYDYGKNVVVPYLLDRKIKTIDYLMVSHFDSDHCGGLFEVVRELKVKNIIIGKQESSYDNCEKFLELAKNKKVNVIVVETGNIIKIDKYTHFEILWPDSKKMFNDSNNGINNNSITARLVYGNFTMLFTGDIEELAEEEIVKMYQNSDILDVDILKVAHHGSKSSSIDEIVEKITPKISLVGVGKDNNYGHPNKDVLERLQNIGSKCFRTDLNGEISIVVNKKEKIKIKKYIE